MGVLVLRENNNIIVCMWKSLAKPILGTERLVPVFTLPIHGTKAHSVFSTHSFLTLKYQLMLTI